ncbi:hypothetical protein J2Z38_001016 [Anaerococcus degeneri]|nr:hypothetical protein [Anaerococcus degeneri]
MYNLYGILMLIDIIMVVSGMLSAIAHHINNKFSIKLLNNLGQGKTRADGLIAFVRYGVRFDIMLTIEIHINILLTSLEIN